MATPRTPRLRALLAYALARDGRPDEREEAMRILEELQGGIASGTGTAFAVAEVYAGLRDFDHAFEWLDRSFDDYTLLSSIMGPAFADVRADSRFERVRKRLRLVD